MAFLKRPFFDSGVLVGGLLDLEQGEHARRIMDAIAAGRIEDPQTAWHCCLEFYAVTTRLPGELRVTPEHAVKLLAEEILTRFTIHDLPPRSRTALLRAVRDNAIVGGRVYDVQIAAVAHASEAKIIVTENRRDFVSLLRHGIRVMTSAEYVAASQ